MKPTTKREEEIVERVDKKARAIRDGAGAWDNRIIREMKIAVCFQMSVAEEQFLESLDYSGRPGTQAKSENGELRGAAIHPLAELEHMVSGCLGGVFARCLHAVAAK
jgi:hypothetical protein